jgi:hypothetical protein
MAYKMTQAEKKEAGKLVQRVSKINDETIEWIMGWLSDNLSIGEMMLLCRYFACDISKLASKIRTLN